MACTMCFVCHRTEQDGVHIQRCSRCHKRPYCSRQCQRRDNKCHKHYCPQHTSSELGTDYEVRTIANKGRGIVALRDYAPYELVLTEAPVASVAAMTPFHKQCAEAVHGAEAMTKAARLAHKVQEQVPDEFVAAVRRLAGGDVSLHRACQLNSFGNDDGDASLFMTASMFNHSCLANCFMDTVMQRSGIEVRTSRPVAAGEEMTLTYCDLTDRARGAALEDHYGFKCDCAACTSPRHMALAEAAQTKLEFWSRCSETRPTEQELQEALETTIESLQDAGADALTIRLGYHKIREGLFELGEKERAAEWAHKSLDAAVVQLGDQHEIVQEFRKHVNETWPR